MKIAVIGAGIFGITSALKLREKFPAAKIVIWDKNISILKAASGINQFVYACQQLKIKDDALIDNINATSINYNKNVE